MKQCTKCKEEKELTEFGKAKQNKDGFNGSCKICIKNYGNKYRLNNKEQIKNNKKKYTLKNKELFKEYYKEYRLNNLEKERERKNKWSSNNKEYYKQYRLNNKVKRNKNTNFRKENEPLFKLKCNIRNLILLSIKRQGYTKKSRTYQLLGCTFEEFKHHLERQFAKGMSWQNQGQWHLDHIYPISLAKDEDELIKLNHYTNFQPLWAIDNLKKGNKITEKQLILI